jgi:hypothetical protein
MYGCEARMVAAKAIIASCAPVSAAPFRRAISSMTWLTRSMVS